MSIDTIYQIESSSFADTFALGERLGKLCKGGEVFMLTADLGGGKTTLVKGLAKGLGYEESVTSPSFTIKQGYKCPNGVEIHHFDFYRLQDAGVVGIELEETMQEPNTVVVIEWGDVVETLVPQHRSIIHISRTAESEKARHIEVRISKERQYLKEALV